MPGQASSDADRLAEAIAALQTVVGHLTTLVHAMLARLREQERAQTANQPTGQRQGR